MWPNPEIRPTLLPIVKIVGGASSANSSQPIASTRSALFLRAAFLIACPGCDLCKTGDISTPPGSRTIPPRFVCYGDRGGINPCPTRLKRGAIEMLTAFFALLVLTGVSMQTAPQCRYTRPKPQCSVRARTSELHMVPVPVSLPEVPFISVCLGIGATRPPSL